MDEQLSNGANNYDLHCDRDNHVIEIFQNKNNKTIIGWVNQTKVSHS